MVANAEVDGLGKIWSSTSPRPSATLEVLGADAGFVSLLRKTAGAAAGVSGRGSAEVGPCFSSATEVVCLSGVFFAGGDGFRDDSAGTAVEPADTEDATVFGAGPSWRRKIFDIPMMAISTTTPTRSGTT
jgi:hypothetical protein